MDYLIAALAILALLSAVAWKVKSLFFKVKDAVIIKEDEALLNKQKTLEQGIKDKRQELNQPVPDMNPEEVEEFWKRNKK